MGRDHQNYLSNLKSAPDRTLRGRMASEYMAAYDEWAASGEAQLWESVSGVESVRTDT
jgi:hypothetical protein